jgi:hypothetical protein
LLKQSQPTLGINQEGFNLLKRLTTDGIRLINPDFKNAFRHHWLFKQSAIGTNFILLPGFRLFDQSYDTVHPL